MEENKLTQYVLTTFRHFESAKEYKDIHGLDNIHRPVFFTTTSYPTSFISNIPELRKELKVLGTIFSLNITFYSNGWIEVNVYKRVGDAAEFIIIAQPMIVEHSDELEKFLYT